MLFTPSPIRRTVSGHPAGSATRRRRALVRRVLRTSKRDHQAIVGILARRLVRSAQHVVVYVGEHEAFRADPRQLLGERGVVEVERNLLVEEVRLRDHQVGSLAERDEAPYSPNVVEEEFCELRHNGVLGSWHTPVREP